MMKFQKTRSTRGTSKDGRLVKSWASCGYLRKSTTSCENCLSTRHVQRLEVRRARAPPVTHLEGLHAQRRERLPGREGPQIRPGREAPARAVERVRLDRRLVAAAALDEGPALALPELPTSKKGVTASTSWSGAQYFSALSAVQLACAAALTLWLVPLRDQPCAPCGAGAGGDGGRHERQRRVPQRHGDAAAAAAAATIHKRAPQER